MVSQTICLRFFSRSMCSVSRRLSAFSTRTLSNRCAGRSLKASRFPVSLSYRSSDRKIRERREILGADFQVHAHKRHVDGYLSDPGCRLGLRGHDGIGTDRSAAAKGKPCQQQSPQRGIKMAKTDDSRRLEINHRQRDHKSIVEEVSR